MEPLKVVKEGGDREEREAGGALLKVLVCRSLSS